MHEIKPNIKEFEIKTHQLKQKVSNNNEYITCLYVDESVNLLFAGTNNGNIKCYLWPIQENEYLVREFAVHKERVTCLSISSDKL